MNRPRVLLIVVSVACGVACEKHTDASGSSPSRPVPTAPASATDSAPARTALSGAASATPRACAGLDRKVCVGTPGCILDQPGPNRYECRDARNACERSALHADMIGNYDKTPRDALGAGRACKAIEGCQLAGGKCACACSVLGDCDCNCGGGLLRRCVKREHVAVMESALPIKSWPPY